MKRHSKRLLSILMAVTLLMGVMSPAFAAADIITHVVDIYADGAPVTARITLMEGDTLQLTPTLIDCSMPTGGSFYWESETPILASVDQAGLLRAHDSSKGAVLRLWIDNDIRTIPVVGGGLATAIEKLFDGLDVDAMDGEGILNIVQSGASILPGDLVDGLIDKLRDRLNSLDTGIRVTVFDADGNVRATDEVRVLVTKSTAITADFFPNGTTITNKSQVPSTVEVGYTFPLQGVTTPMRLHMGVNWTIKKGKEFATLSDTGLATFTAPGEVTLMASPDVQGFMDNVLKYADLVGDDPETIAGTVANLLGKLGIPISTTIMKYALWGLLVLVGTDNVVQWSSGAISTVANYLLQLGTNDTVTVKIVQNLPVTSFTIAGNTTVQEGSTQQLAVTNLVPKGATDQGIEWTVANTDYAGIGKSNGLLIGRDAGSSGGTRATTVTAVLDGVSAAKGVTVTGKNSSTVTEIVITGPSVALIGVMTQMTFKAYPARLIPVITWGLVADDGTTEVFATASASAENSLARINKNGILTPLEGGSVTIVAKTSESVKTYYKIFVGTLVTGLAIHQAPNVAVEVPLSQNYKNSTVQLTPVFSPADATNKNVIWSSSSGDITVDSNGVCSPAKNSAAYAVITAKSQDGGFKDTCVVSFANYLVTEVTLDNTSVSLHEEQTIKLTESVAPKGFLSMGSASIKDVFWSSSDNSVATVSGGTVTALTPGDTVITATTVDGFKTATCTVAVRANKTALNEMIDLVIAANLNAEDYPPEDFDAFTQTLEDALTVQSTTLATQVQCDDATQYLAIHFNALNQYNPVQGITLTFDGSPAPDYKTYKVGIAQIYSNQSLAFSYALTPADADYKSITWSSSKSGIEVDQNGKCNPSANKAAWSIITVRAEDYLGNIHTDSVTVAFSKVPATGISLDTTAIGSALVHNTYQLTATVTPTGTPLIGTDIDSVQWVSNNPDAATVNGSGLVTCVGPGSAIITAHTRDGGFTATCSITVYINKQLLETALNTVNNANLDYLRYTPTSWNNLLVALETAQTVFDNPDAVQTEIDSATNGLNVAYTGLVLYIYANSVAIWYNGSAAGDFISKDVTLVQIYTNQTVELSARLSPLDSYYESIVWRSSSATISVDQNGVCKPTANKACYAIITVTATTYYGRTLTDSVYVAFAKDNATRVDMTPASINASIGNAAQQITYVVKSQGAVTTPDADLQQVIWSSDNPDAVPVSPNGTVSFLNAGSANIRATSVDGGVYGVCTVIVSGDKTALAQAIAFIDAQNVNPQDYEYTTSTAFTNAYNHAVEVYNGVTYTQQGIDEAAASLYSTFEALEPYTHMTDLTILHDGSPAPSHIPVKVKLSQLYKNQSVQLSYSFAPANAMFTSITWSSNDASITVDQNGKCSPSENKAGGALITLTGTDHFGNTMTDSVFVAFSNYPVTGMTIDQSSLSVLMDNAPPVTINASFTPTGTLGARVTKAYWTSSDPTIASVAPDGELKGVVTFVDAGECVITATSYDGNFTQTCTVTVRANKTALVNAISAISGFVLDPELYTPTSWATFAAALESAIVVRDTVYARQIDVDNAKNALLSAFDGLVMYINIQAVYPTFNGEITNGYVTKDVPLSSSYKNQNIQLGYALFPADTTLGTISWSSSNGSISVDQNGLCTPTANSACRAVITVTATDYGGDVRTGSINVCFANYPVTGVSVSPSSIPDAINGGTATLTTSVTPAGTVGVGAANFSDVTWSTNEPSIATVTAGGLVTFKNAGVATITATTVDGGFTADCTVTVSANKAALLTALNKLNTLTQTQYTPTSWSAMLAVRNTSNTVYNKALATQAEVDTATANLTVAYAALAPYIYINSAAVGVAGVNQDGYVIVHVAQDAAYTSVSTTLGLVLNPSNAMYASIVWSSSDPKISVTQSGVVKSTVDQPCFATLTANITDHFGNHYTAKAVVAFVKVAAESITVSPSIISAGINSGTVQLTATLIGENGQTPDYPGIVWTTSNPAVAAVDQNGLVTIGIGGLAYVTASTEIGELSARCSIYVAIDKTALANIINTVMQANYNPLNFSAASYATLKAALTSARAVYANPASDQTAVDQATDALTAANNGLAARQRLLSVTITSSGSPAPEFISKKVELHQRYDNQSIELGVTFNPVNAEYQSLTWSSSDGSILVDETGKCTTSENKAGCAIITATAVDSFGMVFTDSVTVSFANYPVTSVTLDKTTLSFMYGGAPQTLTALLKPSIGTLVTATIKTVTWRSSNTDVATVNADGAVTPVRPGTAVITCYTDDSGKTASCTVTVTGPQLYAASGSPVTINREKKLVYGVPEGSTSISQYFSTPYGTLAYTPTALGYGTGTRIDILFEGNVVDSYYLVIFGDADGDGYANGGDAVYAALAVSYMAELSDLLVFALDLNGDGKVDSADVQKLERVGMFMDTIDQVHPY